MYFDFFSSKVVQWEYLDPIAVYHVVIRTTAGSARWDVIVQKKNVIMQLDVLRPVITL